MPLAEEVERYQIEVWMDGLLLRREFSDFATWTYANTTQLADGISGLYDIRIAQVSQSYGPGPYKELRIIPQRTN